MEQQDGSDALQALATSLRSDLQGNATDLVVTLHRTRLFIAYRRIVFLRWQADGHSLTCATFGWRRRAYVARDAQEAQAITVRLVFEFVKWRRGQDPLHPVSLPSFTYLPGDPFAEEC